MGSLFREPGIYQLWGQVSQSLIGAIPIHFSCVMRRNLLNGHLQGFVIGGHDRTLFVSHNGEVRQDLFRKEGMKYYHVPPVLGIFISPRELTLAEREA